MLSWQDSYSAGSRSAQPWWWICQVGDRCKNVVMCYLYWQLVTYRKLLKCPS